MTSAREQFRAMAAAGAGSRPQDREDWRRPIRSLMLFDARYALLVRAEAPIHVCGSLASRPVTSWPVQVRERVRSL